MNLQFASSADADDDLFEGLFSPTEFNRTVKRARKNAGHVLQLLSNAPNPILSKPEKNNVAPRRELIAHKRERDEDFQYGYEQLQQKRLTQYPVIEQNYGFRRQRYRQQLDYMDDTLTTITYNTNTNFTEFTNRRDSIDSSISRQHRVFDGLHWQPPPGTLPRFAGPSASAVTKQQQIRQTQDDPHLPQLLSSQLLSQHQQQQQQQQEDSQELLQKKKDIQDMLDIKGKGRMMPPLQPLENDEMELEFNQSFMQFPEPMGKPIQPLPLSPKQQEQPLDNEYYDDDIEYDYGDQGGEFAEDHRSENQEAGLVTKKYVDADDDMNDFQDGIQDGHSVENGNQNQTNAQSITSQKGSIVRVHPKRRFASEKLELIRNPVRSTTSYHSRYYSGATIAKSIAKKNFDLSSSLPCRADVRAKLQEVSELFFDQLVDDLSAYATHRNSLSIGAQDVELLLKRQGILDENISIELLAHRHLSRDQWDELCTSAQAYNVLYPHKK